MSKREVKYTCLLCRGTLSIVSNHYMDDDYLLIALRNAGWTFAGAWTCNHCVEDIMTRKVHEYVTTHKLNANNVLLHERGDRHGQADRTDLL